MTWLLLDRFDDDYPEEVDVFVSPLEAMAHVADAGEWTWIPDADAYRAKGGRWWIEKQP